MIVKYTNGKEIYFAADEDATKLLQLTTGDSWRVCGGSGLTVGDAIKAKRMIEIKKFVVEDNVVIVDFYSDDKVHSQLFNFATTSGRFVSTEPNFVDKTNTIARKLVNDYVVMRTKDIDRLSSKLKKQFMMIQGELIHINSMNNKLMNANEIISYVKKLCGNDSAIAYDKGFEAGVNKTKVADKETRRKMFEAGEKVAKLETLKKLKDNVAKAQQLYLNLSNMLNHE